MQLDLDSLLRPIPGDDPVGGDIRAEASVNSIYFKLKDARAQARTIERAIEAAGDPPSVPQEWRTVRALTIEVLTTRSKDMEVAAWLLEALLRLDGFSGLRNGFVLLQGLVESFWPAIHSIDEDDEAGRVSPLSGLNGIGADGALVQPIRMVSLLPESSYGVNALWQLTRIQKEPNGSLARDFNDARAAAGLAALSERALQASAARDAFASLTAALELACGGEAPPSSNIRNALDEVLDAYRSLIGGGVLETGTQTAEPRDISHDTPRAPETSAPPPPPLVTGPKEIATREEAFTELLRIADFFRRNEPHSPISYALETLVWRGRMSFIDLLEELMPDAGSRKQLLQHAGIHATTDGKTR